jgi:ABC-type multidrug transport system ATPase subunit
MTLVFDRVSAPPLVGVSFELGPGTHVLLGTPEDGTHAAIAVAAGAVAPRAGRVSLGGADPRRSPAARRRIGSLLELEELPPAARVVDAVRAALALHGSAGDPAAALASVGLEAWAARATRKLSPRERRSVALAIALGVDGPLLLALSEPLADVPGIDRRAARDAIATRSRQAVVLCATASVRDALELGGTTLVLHRGRIVRTLAGATSPDLAPRQTAELVLSTDDARALAGALAEVPSVSSACWNDREAPGQLTVRGDDLERLALGVVRAARDAGIRIHALGPALPSVLEVKAASAGVARAAYDEAYRLAAERARADKGVPT